MFLGSWKQFYASFDGSVRLKMLFSCWKIFYASLDRSVQLEMHLCSWKRFYASLDGSVRLEMLLCGWKRLYTNLNGSVRQETLMQLYKFIQVWTDLWERDWKRFYANMGGSVRQEMVLCSWNQMYATDCWQELHFEFSRQNLNWNVQSPSMWWWLITHPRPIWKKAPAGLQRPSHTECRIPGDLYWPDPSVPHLGPTAEVPLLRLAVPIRLLIKDANLAKNKCFQKRNANKDNINFWVDLRLQVTRTCGSIFIYQLTKGDTPFKIWGQILNPYIQIVWMV